MTYLILGLILWTYPHLIKQLTPGIRSSMSEGTAKGLVAVTTLISVVLMVVGYRSAEFSPVYDPPMWGIHANNVLMLLSVFLFGASHSKSRIRYYVRHPMLLGAVAWAAAHLLANGDVASLVLFGGIAVWAVVAMLITNANVHEFTRFAGGSVAGDFRLAIITLVVFAVIAAIHTWLGYWPFPG